MARSPDLISLEAAGAARPIAIRSRAWACRMQDHVISAPVRGNRGPAPLGHDDHDRYLKAATAQKPQQVPNLHEVTPGIYQDDVSGRRAGRGGNARGLDPDRMREQAQRRQDVDGRLRCATEQEHIAQALPPPARRAAAGCCRVLPRWPGRLHPGPSSHLDWGLLKLAMREGESLPYRHG